MPDLAAAREAIAALFAAGIASADPRAAVRNHLTFAGDALRIAGRELDVRSGRVVAIAVGKAAFPMAQGLVDVLGERIDAGIVLTKDGHVPPGGSIPGFAIREAAHPVPDQRGVDATREILDLVGTLDTEDTVIALISGGGSALLEAPAGSLGLDDIQAVTSALLRAGAPIQDLNAVRSELSLVKGGGLRRAIGPARCVTLILSDVLGNDPSVIASGPTVARVTDRQRALALLDHYDLRDEVPRTVVSWLESPLPDAAPLPAHADDIWSVLADNASFVEAMAEEARRSGWQSEIVWHGIEGEAAERGVEFVERCRATADDITVVLGGGETTVTVQGDGVGGRNTEFALAAAGVLADQRAPWVIASLASDGDDGANRGAAGGVVDAGTIARGTRLGLDAMASLAENDSGTYLAATGDLFRCELTGTNVNDAYIGIRIGPRE